MRLELSQSAAAKSLLKNRWLQLAVYTVMLTGFIFAILAGFAGTPVGNHNFSIVFIWIAWWAILILVGVPFFGRGWCAVCPIPLPGEWIQRGAILEPPAKKPRWLNLRWPNKLRNIWVQNATFTLVALFSSVILTTPQVTAVVLVAMFFLAIGMSTVFQRRSFCRYICPVGGFIGLYSQVAPIELRVKNKPTCAACADKPCYNGSQAGYGCPWDVFPGGMTKNTACGLCMECLRTCPYDNIALNLRPFAADLARPSRKTDEAFKAFIMLGSAMIYSGVLLGPWGRLKLAAYSVGSPAWFSFTLGFLALIFGLLPVLFLGTVKAGQALSKFTSSTKHTFSAFATALVPLGLMFWVAFSLSFVLTNSSYILIAASDPFGWGWNLFGGAGTAWKPTLTMLLIPLQTLALSGGLLWSAHTARKVGIELKVSAIPVIAFATLVTLAMLGLLL